MSYKRNNDYINNYISETFGIDKRIIHLIKECEDSLEDDFAFADEIAQFNQMKIIKAFQDNKISDTHFGWNTGYGYDDPGRDAVERVYASVFKSDASLVRTNIVNGTHALAITLMGILRPGDEVIYATGKPYDTLEEVIGIRGENMGSLAEYHISHKIIELNADGSINMEGILKEISPKTKMVYFQRATGYAWRPSISVDMIEEVATEIHNSFPNIVTMTDNCYGEFLDYIEPTEAGIDIMAGSLIKNPGGGLALSGGYVVGRKDLIEKVAYRLTCPGIGGECGLTYGQSRTILQGLFMAPQVVNGAIKGAMLCGSLYEKLGYDVCPKAGQSRSDIIQSIRLGSEDAIISFCRGIQAAAPIDSHVTPVPWDMPGYDSKVIMAAGAFIQGSSIELSADAPIREPYDVYFQGGLSYYHSKFGIMKATDNLLKEGLLKGLL